VQETPSAANSPLRLVTSPIGRFAKTDSIIPDAFALNLVIGIWQAEHSFSMAALAREWTMVSLRTEACQYGSLADWAIIEDLQLDPIETSSPEGEINPLWQAMHWSDVTNICGRELAEAAPVPWAAESRDNKKNVLIKRNTL
jgi:hypothetical protein